MAADLSPLARALVAMDDLRDAVADIIQTGKDLGLDIPDPDLAPVSAWLATAADRIIDRDQHDCGKGDYCPQYGRLMDVVNGAGVVVTTIDLDAEVAARRRATTSNQWASIVA